MTDGVRAENDSAHAIIRLWGFVHKALTLMMGLPERAQSDAKDSSE